IFTIEEALPDIHDTLIDTDKDAKEAKGMVGKALSAIPEAKQLTDDGASSINTVLEKVDQVKTHFENLEPRITQDLQKAQLVAHEINELIDFANNEDSVEKKLD